MLTCVSHFALRVLACAKISNLFIVHFVHGTNLSNSLREFFIAVIFGYKKKTTLVGGSLFIGIARFELTTSCSRSKRSTRLSYIPFCFCLDASSLTRTIIVNFDSLLKG